MNIDDFMNEIHLMEKELSTTVLCNASMVDTLLTWKDNNPMGQWYTIVGSPYVQENQIILIKSELLKLPGDS